MAFVWSKDIETGNTIIDGEHKELIKAINDMLEACLAGHGREQLAKTVDFLESYTAKHFSHEEELQVKYGYPDHQNHHKLHEGFKKFVHDVSVESKTVPSTTLVGKVTHGIGDWLVGHIKAEDTKVAAHIKSKVT
ncbi:MAG: hemerythrin family protein [Planctomycetaceae bacterium]|jgi:hemerythrin|nr:hemerythrin family protein [Planctomycetaceae bacterium]